MPDIDDIWDDEEDRAMHPLPLGVRAVSLEATEQSKDEKKPATVTVSPWLPMCDAPRNGEWIAVAFTFGVSRAAYRAFDDTGATCAEFPWGIIEEDCSKNGASEDAAIGWIHLPDELKGGAK